MARTSAPQTLDMMLKGAPELQARINDIVNNTRDLREVWKRFYRPAFYEAMEQVFDTKQSGTWKPLNKRYAKWKASKYGSAMMVATGDLKAAMTAGTGDGFFEPRPQEMEIGGQAVGPGNWNSPNTPGGRMVIWANSTAMRFHMRNAAEEHVAWYARKWAA